MRLKSPTFWLKKVRIWSLIETKLYLNRVHMRKEENWKNIENGYKSLEINQTLGIGKQCTNIEIKWIY